MPATGELFGRYRLLRRLAFGGMAEIFLASLERDQGFEKRVVLKRILPQFGADPAFTRMFVDEAVVAARLTHPNVVQIHDFGNVDGVYFIAMEHVDGVDLRRVLQHGASELSPAEVAAIGEHIARGLSYAHNVIDDGGRAVGIVHRDVSPHNIMVSRSGEAKIMDFGIAKAEARATRTATGTIKGKVAYMAPEQAGGYPVDKRCDQFALGLVLWECLSGERMFDGDSDMELLRKVVACDVRPLRQLRPDVPEALDAAIARTLKPEPEQRFADASELAEALAAFRFSLGAAGAVQLGRLVEASGVEPAIGRRTRSLPSAGAPASVDDWGHAAANEAATAGMQPAAATATGGSAAATASGSSSAVADNAAVAHPDTGSATATAGLPERARAWVAIGVAALLIAAGLGVAGVALRRDRHGSSAVTPLDKAPPAATLVISSVPPGAQVVLDGRQTGLQTPARIPGLSAGSTVVVSLSRADYELWQQPLVVDETTETLTARLVARVAAKPVAEAAATAPPAVKAAGRGDAAAVVAPAKRRAARGKRSRARPPPAGQGKLWLRSAGAWVDVFLGERHLGTTPLAGVTVPSGRLRLRLVNRSAGVEDTVTLDVAADAEVRRTVTPKTR